MALAPDPVPDSSRGCLGGFAVHVGGTPIIDTQDGRTEVEYRYSIELLLAADLIESPGIKGETFAVTHHGYLLADSLIAAGTA